MGTNGSGSGGPTEQAGTITFVGGGDAGLMTALIIRQLNPEVEITVIDDFEEDIPEVGKSTTTYILHTFHEFLDIDTRRFISDVKPIWKASVYFTDWCGRGPFHVPFDGFTLQPSTPSRRRFEVLYARHQHREFHTLGAEIAERGVSAVMEESGNLYDQVAYHLSTNRLNTFLRELCDERDIDLVNDRITEVETRNNRITRLVSDAHGYDADLYVDATGFDRLLMGHLDNEFNAFDFPLDSALVAQTDVSLSDIVPATVINTGEHGWFWQIDTFDCRDLGYVYSSRHVSDDAAMREFITEKDEPIDESSVQQYRFESGVYTDAWVNNCIAVGNALGFVEPLQSTALTLNAQLTEKLSELFADHYRINHDGVRSLYNSIVRSMWDNIYDFISVHYRFAAGETDFWRDAKSVNETENLRYYLDNYHENGFNSYTEFDGTRGPGLMVFNQYLFYQLLRDLGVKSEFYEGLDLAVPEARADIEAQNERIAQTAANHLSYEEVYQQEIFN